MSVWKSILPFIGDRVYIYSNSLDEVIEGILEGYADNNTRRYKVLQFLDTEESNLRHIVSNIYTFATYEEALRCKEEYGIKSSIDIRSGNIVYLLDKLRQPVSDMKGNICEYQVVSVYRDTMKAGLVTSYGEYIGLYDLESILYVDEGPIFKKEDYKVGNKVVWVDNEDVYEGIIDYLHDATASIKSVKKLFSVDYRVRIPYWKIPEGRESYGDNATNVIHTIIGDDLD